MAEQQVPSHLEGKLFSTDPETLGFELSAGSQWIYPENYPRRDYQFSIVQTALYNNTLVCLPTGLGKTFIAAVVMYNFWRWYPKGRVVFLAPTKPLVAQQIDACHEIMGIPSQETVELTGAINKDKRRQAWVGKRVIFATPQTFQNDLVHDIVPCQLIKCIVIDEAHRALGKHSYCEIVRMLNEKNKFFRILALSATPGSKVDHVREVIQNLLISELELRDDSSPDIMPYTNTRSMEKIIVGLGAELSSFKDQYINIMDPHVRVLVKHKVLQTHTANISKGRIFMLLKQFDSNPQNRNQQGIIKKTLNILLTMYHAYELLIKHGLRAFYNFYSTHSDKFWFDTEIDLQVMLENIKRCIGELPVIQPLPDGTIPDIPSDLKFGHNKFEKLRELLTDHFRSFAAQNKSTRAIVFVEYRDIVNEVYVLLLQTRPLIRPQMFVGQAGQKQKEQIAALDDFRNDKVNVLISTSVGEEGLDVGEVDLIICFDISSSTPTRLVQRMGRTGRKRSGRVVILLTEGKEVQTLNQALSKKDSLNNKVLQSSNISSSLYQSSPWMVPVNITPECSTIFIKALPKTPKVKGKRKQTKPPGEKKPRKSKKNAAADEQNLENVEVVPGPSTSKVSGSIQSSMTKFLTNQRSQNKQTSSTAISHNEYDSDSGILLEEFQPPLKPNSSDPYSCIRPCDVKLLTSDSHMNEFLILCTIKKSEQESNQETKSYMKVDDKTWLPKRTPPRLIFDEIEIPDLEILECIKHLAPFESSNEESEVHSVYEGSVSESVPPVVDDSNSKVQSDFFNAFSPPCNSKYAKTTEQTAQVVKELADVDFFVDDFSSSANSEKKIEFIGTSFFDEDVTFIHEVPQCSEQSRELSVEAGLKTPKNERFDHNDQSQETLVEMREITPTNEVLYCLDQNRESPVTTRAKTLTDEILHHRNHSQEPSVEMKEKVPVNEASQRHDQSRESSVESRARTPANVEVDFDALLDEGTESECSQRGEGIEATVEDANIFDELLEGDFSSDEEEIFNITMVHNTTLVGKRSASRSSEHEKEKPVPKRQKTEESSDSEAVPPTPPTDKNLSQSILDYSAGSIVAAPAANDDSDVDMFEDMEFETQFTFRDNKPIQSPVKQNTEKDEEAVKVAVDDLALNELSTLDSDNDKTLMPELELPSPKMVDDKPTISTDEKSNEKVEKIKENKSNTKVDLDFEDWGDECEFDMNVCVVEKEKIEQEKVSSFFKQKSRSQEASSSGWIDTKKPSVFSFKNKSAKTNRPSLSLKKKPEEVQKNVMSAQGVPRPNTALLSLNRDKDGFAMPFKKLNKIDNDSRGKENCLPSWRRDKSISPRFRRYHSENNITIDSRKEEERRKRKKPRRRIANDFLDDEAEVSSDLDTSGGSSCEEDEDKDLGSFVSYTQDVHDDVDMRAHYLQTVNKSPIHSGAFMFKKPRNVVPIHEIYSQPITQSQADESYMHDSFCVGDETQFDDIKQDSDGSSSDSILSCIESSSESRRRKVRDKRREKFKSLQNKRRLNKNKRNVRSISSRSSSSSSSCNTGESSSEDETEALRREILEESMMMKERKSKR